MYILLVHIQVKPERIDDFKKAILENASNSVKEAGVVRFDVLQQNEDPTRFTLVEVYKNPEAHQLHRETSHYLTWRDTVTDWMAEPRIGLKYSNLFPDDTGWN
jgi:autoinducer 2-degrading protein